MNMKKKVLFVLLVLSLFMLMAIALIGCKRDTYFTVTYYAGIGGNIIGDSEQHILAGKDTKDVTVVANEGYEFLRWSDGNINTTRKDTNITEFKFFSAIFRRLEYTVNYVAETGGFLEGKTNQTIKHGENSEIVIAIAKEGYEFSGWSDGVTLESRLDENIKADLSVTAQFKKIFGTFTYKYNNATANNESTTIFLKRNELNNIEFSMPQKQYFNFCGWYLDTDFNIQVTDANGNITIGNELFDYKKSELYAKWEVIEEIKYRILMVYDTAVKADLELADGTVFKVDYQMSPIEKQLCIAITEQFGTYLNRFLDGLITFEIDSYFTAKPLGINQITLSRGFTVNGDRFNNYYISPENIPEISGMLDNYRSVINTFNFNDYKSLLKDSVGTGCEKFASLSLEAVLAQSIANKVTIESLLDFTNKEWDGMMDSYVHEFIHTIEQGITSYRYHKVLAEYMVQGLVRFEPTIAYLRNQAQVSNETINVGIPYSYWKNEIYSVKYEFEYGGYLDSDWSNGWNGYIDQKVPKGTKTCPLTAYAFQGYKFVGWSDGVTTATRTDYNIQSDFTVTACFEKLAFDVQYKADIGGSIVGKAFQSVLFHERSETVIAVADEGYRFIGWSDGYMDAERSDFIGIDESANLTGISVTALFEKINE